MTIIYIAAAIFGGLFVIPMIFGGLDSEIDAGGGLDVDVDTDLDLDGDFDSDTDSAVDAVGSFVSTLLSFRSLVFFLFFFGISGLLFEVLDTAAALTLVLALGLGLVSAVANAQLFNYLKRSGGSSQRLARDIEGHSAKVILPISGSQKGRIRADLSGQPTFMVAVPFNKDGSFGVGDSVVVVEVANGTARVAALNLASTEQLEEKE